MALSTFGFDANRVAQIADRLFEFTDEQMGKPRKVDCWSRKEILGHLIDSASVNHQRIMESQISGSLVFEGYDHERWVELQGYQEMDWEEIVTTWCALNMQLCTIVDRIEPDVLGKQHEQHSYDRTAFRSLNADQPSTLGYLIEDYFAHLQYHLDQILS
jgi:DinB superfamily